MFSVSEHVWADFGHGKVLAHIVKAEYTNPNGEQKYGVQAPDGSEHELGYREPTEGSNTGDTFWKI